jgi:hypothetical protein
VVVWPDYDRLSKFEVGRFGQPSVVVVELDMRPSGLRLSLSAINPLKSLVQSYALRNSRPACTHHSLRLRTSEDCLPNAALFLYELACEHAIGEDAGREEVRAFEDNHPGSFQERVTGLKGREGIPRPRGSEGEPDCSLTVPEGTHP